MSRRGAISDVFTAVADPTRRAILDALAAGDQPVGEIAVRFDMTLSAVSQHMKVLRDSGIVDVRREGRHRVYRLMPRPLREVHDWSARYERFWSEKLEALACTLDTMEVSDERKG